MNAQEQNDIGGFYISTYDYIFRWLIRGYTLCEVTIPDKEKIYKTTSKNGIYVAEKIILSNPKKINDDFAISELESFCQRREEEKYINDFSAIQSVKILYTKLKQIQDSES